MIEFALGMLIGAVFGVFMMCVFIMSGDCSKKEREE